MNNPIKKKIVPTSKILNYKTFGRKMVKIFRILGLAEF
jgi:hypothetical protein